MECWVLPKRKLDPRNGTSLKIGRIQHHHFATLMVFVEDGNHVITIPFRCGSRPWRKDSFRHETSRSRVIKRSATRLEIEMNRSIPVPTRSCLAIETQVKRMAMFAPHPAFIQPRKLADQIIDDFFPNGIEFADRSTDQRTKLPAYSWGFSAVRTSRPKS